MKEYERIAKIEKEMFILKEEINMNKADLAGWDLRMEKEKERYEALQHDYNEIVKRKQLLFKNSEKRLDELSKHLISAQDREYEEANKKAKKVVCQYCGEEFHKRGLASHEAACKEKNTITKAEKKLTKNSEDKLAKKQALEEELKKMQEQLDLLNAEKELKKGEEAEIEPENIGGEDLDGSGSDLPE